MGENQKLNPLHFGGPNCSLLAMSLKGEFPLNKKEFLCVIILCKLNQISQQNRVSRDFCWGYASNHFLCVITSSDSGIPFPQNMGTPS